MHLVNRLWLTTLALLPLVASCNLYRSFSSAVSSEDLIEEARACLHAGDYDCAIANYELLPAGAERTEKLCVVNVAKAGLGLNVMIDTITNNATDSNFVMLGQLANQLLPYTAAKEAAAVEAKTHCDAMGGVTRTAKLMKILSRLVDCAVRMGKTDTLVSDTNEPASCNSTISKTGDGAITAADIGGDAGGDITVTDGMCDYDANMCLEDLEDASNESLASQGLTTLEDNLDLIPAGLLAAGTANAIRVQLKDTLE